MQILEFFSGGLKRMKLRCLNYEKDNYILLKFIYFQIENYFTWQK